MTKSKKQKLFQATAALHTSAGQKAYHAFAASSTKPILQKLEEQSYMRQLFRVERLGPGQQPTYPLPDEFESPVWILPGMGYVVQDYIELLAEEVSIRTFNVQAAKDWLLKYAREGRVDVAVRAQQAVAKALADYEEEAGWRTIVPAAVTGFRAGCGPPSAALAKPVRKRIKNPTANLLVHGIPITGFNNSCPLEQGSTPDAVTAKRIVIAFDRNCKDHPVWRKIG